MKLFELFLFLEIFSLHSLVYCDYSSGLKNKEKLDILKKYVSQHSDKIILNEKIEIEVIKKNNGEDEITCRAKEKIDFFEPIFTIPSKLSICACK